MNDEILNQIAAANEAIVKKQFKKLNYSVERLDRKKKRPRPDFLVSGSGRPHMLCEVKTIFSAGCLRDKDKGFAHVSTLDENLSSFGVFKKDIDLTKINDGLADAVRKRSALVEAEPRFAHLPLLVAFFFDFFADFLHFLPRTFDKDISGILTIETDVARTKAFDQLSCQEQERGPRPQSKDFVLVRNKAARRKVPPEFQIHCITEPYDASL